MRVVKTMVIAVLVCTFVAGESVAPAYAGGVSGVASEWTQILNWVQLQEDNCTALNELEDDFQSLQNQLQQIQNQEKMIGHAERQTQSLLDVTNNPVFKDAFADMSALTNIIQNGQGLAYSMANMDQEFENRYKSFGYTTAANYQGQYKRWMQTSLDTSHAALLAVGVQGTQLPADTAALTAIQANAKTTTGMLATVQVANTLAGQEVLELQKLRQIILADVTSKQAFQAQQISEGAAAVDLNNVFFSNPQNSDSDGRTFDAIPY